MTTRVALHGFLGDAHAWDGVFAGASHLGLTLPFHGDPPAHAECTDWEDALDCLTRELPDGPLALFGYSLGARLALGLCVRLGARIQSAVLVSGHAGLDTGERAARGDFEASMADRLETARDMATFVDEWERLPLFASQARLSEAARTAQRRVRERHHPRVVARAFQRLGTSRMPSYEALLPSLAIPLCFVSGALDTKYDALAARYAASTAHGRHVSLADVGHNPLLEAPTALRAQLHESLS